MLARLAGRESGLLAPSRTAARAASIRGVAARQRQQHGGPTASFPPVL